MTDGKKNKLSLKSRPTIAAKYTSAETLVNVTTENVQLSEAAASVQLAETSDQRRQIVRSIEKDSDIVLLSDSTNSNNSDGFSSPFDNGKDVCTDIRPQAVDANLKELRKALVQAWSLSAVGDTTGLPECHSLLIAECLGLHETREAISACLPTNPRDLPPLPQLSRQYYSRRQDFDIKVICRANGSRENPANKGTGADGGNLLIHLEQQSQHQVNFEFVQQRNDCKEQCSLLPKRPLFNKKPNSSGGASVSVDRSYNDFNKRLKKGTDRDSSGLATEVPRHNPHCRDIQGIKELSCSFRDNIQQTHEDWEKCLATAATFGSARVCSSPTSPADIIVPVPNCPLCQLTFPEKMNSVDRDGHISRCLAAADDGAFDELMK